jgi:hypothetical protein
MLERKYKMGNSAWGNGYHIGYDSGYSKGRTVGILATAAVALGGFLVYKKWKNNRSVSLKKSDSEIKKLQLQCEQIQKQTMSNVLSSL